MQALFNNCRWLSALYRQSNIRKMKDKRKSLEPIDFKKIIRSQNNKTVKKEQKNIKEDNIENLNFF